MVEPRKKVSDIKKLFEELAIQASTLNINNKTIVKPKKKVFDVEKLFEQPTKQIKTSITKIEQFTYSDSVKSKIKTFESFNINNLVQIFTSETNSSKLKNIINNTDSKLIYKALIKTPEPKLDLVFEKITYGKLAALINNLSDKQANKLINYLLPNQLEKVMNLISTSKLDKLFDENANKPSLDNLIEQQLAKLADANISDEQLTDIIILAEEEKLIKNFGTIPTKNLARIINLASDNSLEKFISIISNKDLERTLSLVSDEELFEICYIVSNENLNKITKLISGKRVAKIEKFLIEEQKEYSFENKYEKELLKFNYNSDDESGLGSEISSDDEDFNIELLDGYSSKSFDIKSSNYYYNNDEGYYPELLGQ